MKHRVLSTQEGSPANRKIIFLCYRKSIWGNCTIISSNCFNLLILASINLTHIIYGDKKTPQLTYFDFTLAMTRFSKKAARVPVQKSFAFHEAPSNETGSGGVLIDHSFPDKNANRLAELESYNKHLFRPNTYLHKWWARRSGTTFRYILKQLQNDQSPSDFYKAGGLEGKIIFDPMMGGGTTLHEAVRMGANVIGVDIDPIPVLQTKASLTLSPLGHKESVYLTFFNRLKKSVGHLYSTSCPFCSIEDAELQFLLYGLRRRCSCRETIFLDSLLLREGNHRNIEICPECHEVFIGVTHRCTCTRSTKLITKGIRKCELCNDRFSEIRKESYRDRYVPLVVVGSCREHGLFFKNLSDADFAALNQSEMSLRNIDFGDEADFVIPNGPKSDSLINRGIKSFLELFTPRQLLYINSAVAALEDFPTDDRLWLGLLVSTSLDFNSLLCGYKGSGIRRPGAIRHVFSHHAYSFPYTALENNPVFSGNTSGTLNRLFSDRIRKAGLWSTRPTETKLHKTSTIKIPIEGEVDGGEPAKDWADLRTGERKFLIFQADSSKMPIPKRLVDFVITDPPYFDNVQYSDLSNFFRVWLRRLLPKDANWDYDQFASAVSEGGDLGDRKYSEVLTGIWRTCKYALKNENGRLVFTFHHWRHSAWAELTLSLKRARFYLVNRYIVHSENPISVHIMGLRALKHDCILVLSPNMDFQQIRNWPKPQEIDKLNSYTFCLDCGSALGWFLMTDLSENEIRSEWKRLLGGKL
jgi:DNA modification methylase